MSSRGIRRRLVSQAGAVTVAGAVWIILMISAAILSILFISGSSVGDSIDSEKQVAALFIAESGLERAQASIGRSVTTGGYLNSTCTGLVTGNAIAFGRGTFKYDAATSTPPVCGGWNTACTECNFAVTGQVDGVRRRIQSQIQAKFIEGVEGHGNQFTLQMNALRSGGAAFTNLAYRATATLSTDVQSNAQVGTCTNTGGSCDVTVNGWDMQRTGTNNVSNMGAFAPVSASGFQTISTTLATNSGSAAARNFVHTGVYFYPYVTNGAVTFKGKYAQPVGNNTTASTSGTTGTLPSNWNCGGSNWATAATSDTLVYGYGSKPAAAGAQLNGVRFGQVQMKRIVSLTGTQGDWVYSQIWYAWNPIYSTTSKAAGAGTTITLSPATTALPEVGSTLAVESGTGGGFSSAEVTGSVTGNTLTVTAVSSGSLQVGDVLFGRQLAPGTRIDSFVGGTGGVGIYRVCARTPTNACATQEAPSGSITARVGVVSTSPATSSFVVSRPPAVALSNANLCGGVCAFIYSAGTANTGFSLQGITSGDDWASGFLCLAGVDPSNVQVLGVTELKRTYWAELVQ